MDMLIEIFFSIRDAMVFKKGLESLYMIRVGMADYSIHIKKYGVLFHFLSSILLVQVKKICRKELKRNVNSDLKGAEKQILRTECYQQ